MDVDAQMMFTSVRMEGCSAENAMRIVHEVREWGLMQGEDFDFAYHHDEFMGRSWKPVRPRYAEFRFYEEQYATMFKLKYL